MSNDILKCAGCSECRKEARYRIKFHYPLDVVISYEVSNYQLTKFFEELMENDCNPFRIYRIQSEAYVNLRSVLSFSHEKI